jgi:hypothetical protein
MSRRNKINELYKLAQSSVKNGVIDPVLKDFPLVGEVIEKMIRGDVPSYATGFIVEALCIEIPRAEGPTDWQLHTAKVLNIDVQEVVDFASLKKGDLTVPEVERNLADCFTQS